MKLISFIIICFLTSTAFSQIVSGDILGTLFDLNTKEPIFNARAVVEDNGRKYQALTEPDGRFRIVGIPTGRYYLYIVCGKDTMKNILADVPMEAYCNLGDIVFERINVFKTVTVKSGVKLVFGELPTKELTAADIKVNVNKFDIRTLAISMSSEIKQDENGELMFRGARKGDMIYIVDGVKCSDVFNVPSVSISKMMVFTGGLPAKYGDTMGGAIVVETKGYFELYRSWLAAQ